MSDGITFTSTQEIVDQAHGETRLLRTMLVATEKSLDTARGLATGAITMLAEEKEKSERIKAAMISFSNETLQDEITGRQAVEAILLLCAEAEKPNA